MGAPSTEIGTLSEKLSFKNYHIPRAYYDWSLEKQFDFQIRSFFPNIANWIEGWLDYYASPDRKIDILFVLYDELKRNPVNYVKKIAEFNQIKDADYSKIPVPENGKLHFRKGEHEQWKVEFSEENKRLVDNLLGDRIAQSFELAAQSHRGFLKGKDEFKKGNMVAAAKSALEAIKQFPNSMNSYELFFQAVNAAGLAVSQYHDQIRMELNGLTIGDYFRYPNQLVASCQQIAEKL